MANDSQPFIADLNGDFLDDILYTDTKQKLQVAYQVKDVKTKFEIMDFASSMLVQDQTEGCLYQSKEQMAAKKLTTPHSVTLVDFDGDCISDLFVTVEDKGKKYYEIYLRRERAKKLIKDETEVKEKSDGLKGLNSYCLVSRELIPATTKNLFSFADVDRDGMIDMMYLENSGSGGLDLVIHYNQL